MALIFRIERAKKRPRITVLREKRQGSKQITPKLLGSFNEKKSVDHITEQLTEGELYEFHNFLSTVNFSKDYFKCSEDELDRFIIKAPPQLKDALYKIWQEARKHGIEFLPEQEMLFAVLNHAKTIEQQLKAITNGEFSALSDLDIDVTSSLFQPKRSMHDNQKIMAALLTSGLSYEKLADKFNEAAVQHDKSPKFNKQYFEILEERLLIDGKEMFPKWHYVIAIEVLKKLGFNLIDVTSPAAITKHWLNLNKQPTFKETLNAFNNTFDELANDDACYNIIKKSFLDDELISMARLPPNNTPTPSMAVNKWLNHLKKSNKLITIQDALDNLKQQYPLAASNGYICELVRRCLSE